jgi:small conductance mechanosensitive channel
MGFFSRTIISAIAIAGLIILPVQAQLPFLPELNWQTFRLNRDPDTIVTSACVRLDGHCLFKISDQKSNLLIRIKEIEQRLENITQSYLQKQNSQLNVYPQEQRNQQNIYISVNDKQVFLMTLSERDAALRGVSLDYQAQQIIDQVKTGIKRAQQERQQPFLLQQGKIAAAIAAAMIVLSLLVTRQQKKGQKNQKSAKSKELPDSSLFSRQLDPKTLFNLPETSYRLLQFLQVGIWIGGSLLILGLFPYTRGIQLLIINVLRIPLRVGLVGWVTYILIRLSYVLIAKFKFALTHNYVLSQDTHRRLQLRVNTISYLVRSIVTALWLILGILIALTIIGIDITPLLAGAGIIGLALSFASQNLIKDALNGFFIILEDQYAVGDVISVGEVSGLVEQLNLRITQLRDAEGRLITIPNSEIKVSPR